MKWTKKGEYMWGHKWKSVLARHQKVNRSSVYEWVNTDRPRQDAVTLIEECYKVYKKTEKK